MKKFALLMLLVGFAPLMGSTVRADEQAPAPIANAAAAKPGKAPVKKKIVYRSHTQVDLTGETVQGKVRAPEVFYIFQRKRAAAHHVVTPPDDFSYHQEAMADDLRRSLPK